MQQHPMIKCRSIEVSEMVNLVKCYIIGHDSYMDRGGIPAVI